MSSIASFAVERVDVLELVEEEVSRCYRAATSLDYRREPG
jgi:hypothetical protein